MGVGGALGVLTSVILANTLLPAVLAMLGHKIDRGGMRLPQADESFEGQQKTPVARWGRFVTSHSSAVFSVALAVCLLLAAPALKVRLGSADAGTAPKSQTTRQAYDILSDKMDGFGPGFTSPITVVVKGEMLAAAEKFRRHGEGVESRLDRRDRGTGGDAAHERHHDRALIPGVARGRMGPDAAEIAGDDARREPLHPRRGDCRRLRESQHLDRASAIGEPANEAALLERHDETMNSGLRPQIERVLHFVEGRRHARLLEALMDETQELALFLGQHESPPPARL